MSRTLIVGETHNGEIKNISLELISAGKIVAEKTNTDLEMVLIGKQSKQTAEKLSKFGLKKIYVYDQNELENFFVLGYTKALSELIIEIKPNYVLFGATVTGKELAPRTAARVNGRIVADVLGLNVENNKISATRAYYTGKLIGEVINNSSEIQFVTIRPKFFQAAAEGGSASEIIEKKVELTANEQRVTLKEAIPFAKGELDVTEADIIVSGGRGMKASENFEILKKISAKMNGAVGASRAVVDAGWMPYKHQVGQTGKSVAPKVYIACGISGAIQHLVGISNAKKVVAINSDANAPIFEYADLGIVGDIFSITEELYKKL